MYSEEYAALGDSAQKKTAFLNDNPGGYFASAMQAGFYVGLGIMLIYTVGGLLAGQAHAKIIMGVSFGIALSLVIMGGAELFTGNNLVMTAGLVRKRVTLAQTLKLWLACFVGNWAGAIALALLFWGSGLADGATADSIVRTSAYKMSTPLVPLFLRGLLCNVLVCLSTWCSYRCKSDAGKLIMIFWCLYCFITSGYEHGIANMSLLTVALLTGTDAAVSFSGYFYNILVASLGNLAGAVFVLALPYHFVSREKVSGGE